VTPWCDSGPVARLESGALQHFSLKRADDGRLIATVMRSEAGEWFGFAAGWQGGPYKRKAVAIAAVEKQLDKGGELVSRT
jgi:hypothetical protein